MSQQMKQIADDTENHIKEAKQEVGSLCGIPELTTDACMRCLFKLALLMYFLQS